MEGEGGNSGQMDGWMPEGIWGGGKGGRGREEMGTVGMGEEKGGNRLEMGK